MPDATPATTAATAEVAPTEDLMRDELMALIEDVFRPVPEGLAALEAQADGAEPPPASIESPLFKDLAREELAAFVRGLRLVTVEPGEIVVTEGEPRGSLFVITSGTLRAYVRHASGRSLPIRDLREGDFFGEISILTGSPRTATLTAATRCELLELDRPTLEAICKTHPHMWVVLKEFHDQRANNTVEAAIRQMDLGGSA
jgi:signal-transduction protein with cAMP-binding, CBS, and nucleotidyltransferase domain